MRKRMAIFVFNRFQLNKILLDFLNHTCYTLMLKIKKAVYN
jgi:hypothetical protein